MSFTAWNTNQLYQSAQHFYGIAALNVAELVALVLKKFYAHSRT